MTFTLSSMAFKNNCAIPEEYTGDGKDVSPPLDWTFAPRGTKSYALICDDPDAPLGTWVHWVLYDIPGTIKSLPEALPPNEVVLDSVHHGVNDFDTLGYGGPAPPRRKDASLLLQALCAVAGRGSAARRHKGRGAGSHRCPYSRAGPHYGDLPALMRMAAGAYATTQKRRSWVWRARRAFERIRPQAPVCSALAAPTAKRRSAGCA